MNSIIRDQSPVILIALKISVVNGSVSVIVHKKDISNAMNNFFCSVGKDLADKIDPAPIPFSQVTMKLINTRRYSTSGLLK